VSGCIHCLNGVGPLRRRRIGRDKPTAGSGGSLSGISDRRAVYF
jgi:hypothetical protein